MVLVNIINRINNFATKTCGFGTFQFISLLLSRPLGSFKSIHQLASFKTISFFQDHWGFQNYLSFDIFQDHWVLSRQFINSKPFHSFKTFCKFTSFKTIGVFKTIYQSTSFRTIMFFQDHSSIDLFHGLVYLR